eukprot:CAMPEP_0198547912 /NCGR_PEP_ID=MMETSP1462-20131121/68501_1 /TAXON_ID=1333877 /ORGANISM="Brandtodinium nutriculum, Strain RCC3387" /LENGTH=134 /DNA_ID=CAMNT_0044278413 /DNA_START=121 /DNA_END=521 /DNA_ORIENTATION=-
MDGKFYGAEKFKPRLIVTQMVAMQASFALSLSAISACVDLAIGEPVSLSQLFWARAYTWETPAGFALATSVWATGLVMAVALRFVVERAKKCLDFVFTYHFFHFVATCYLTGFPSNFQWWAINFVALLVAVLLG